MSVLLRSSILRQSAAASRRPSRWLSTAAAATRQGSNPNKGKGKEEGKTPETCWSEDLASDAEAFVKASREEIDATEDFVSNLDEKTKTLLKPKGIKR